MRKNQPAAGEKYTTALRHSDAVFRPDHCAACDQRLDPGDRSLFCSDGCKDGAKAVRWVRRHLTGGKFIPAQVRYGILRDEDYAEALYTKLRSAVSGGYGRRVSVVQRETVWARDDGRCVRCGAPGEEVDHIRGDSADPSNLQLLCRTCHDSKTRSQSREGKRLAVQGQPTRSWSLLLRELVRASGPVRDLISQRILVPQPLRLCDDSQWQDVESRLRSERSARLRELLEVLFGGEVPGFASHTPWREKMDAARDYHAGMWDEGPCENPDCSECSRRNFSGSWIDDDPDVHAGYGPGSYFAHAMDRDD